MRAPSRFVASVDLLRRWSRLAFDASSPASCSVPRSNEDCATRPFRRAAVGTARPRRNNVGRRRGSDRGCLRRPAGPTGRPWHRRRRIAIVSPFPPCPLGSPTTASVSSRAGVSGGLDIDCFADGLESRPGRQGAAAGACRLRRPAPSRVEADRRLRRHRLRDRQQRVSTRPHWRRSARSGTVLPTT